MSPTFKDLFLRWGFETPAPLEATLLAASPDFPVPPGTSIPLLDARPADVLNAAFSLSGSSSAALSLALSLIRLERTDSPDISNLLSFMPLFDADDPGFLGFRSGGSDAHQFLLETHKSMLEARRDEVEAYFTDLTPEAPRERSYARFHLSSALTARAASRFLFGQVGSDIFLVPSYLLRGSNGSPRALINTQEGIIPVLEYAPLDESDNEEVFETIAVLSREMPLGFAAGSARALRG